MARTKNSIGNDVLKKGVEVTRSRVEFEFGPPFPFDFAKFKISRETEKGRKLSDEEVKQLYMEYLLKQNARVKQQDLRLPTKDMRLV